MPISYDELKKLAQPSMGTRIGRALQGAGMGMQGQVYTPPQDTSKDLLKTMMLEKFKADMTPQKPQKWSPATMEEAIEFEKQKRGVTTSNIPEIIEPEEGYEIASKKFDTKSGRWIPATAKPIKTEPTIAEKKFKLEQEEKQRSKELSSQLVLDSANENLQAIQEIKSGIKNFGLIGGLPSIPGTPRAKWEANINKLLSQKIVDLMSVMKNASKTGATGFGQLSGPELKVLQDASTTLKRTLSPQDAEVILNDMERKLQKIVGGSQQTPQIGQQGQQQYSEEDIQHTMQKYGMSRDEVLNKLQGR